MQSIVTQPDAWCRVFFLLWLANLNLELRLRLKWFLQEAAEGVAEEVDLQQWQAQEEEEEAAAAQEEGER